MLGECWGSVWTTLHTPQTLYTSAFQKIGGSGEVFGDFRLFCVNRLEKYSYQPIPQLAQPVPRLAQPVPHLYQLYKKRAEPHYEAPPSLYMNVCY